MSLISEIIKKNQNNSISANMKIIKYLYAECVKYPLTEQVSTNDVSVRIYSIYFHIKLNFVNK